MGRGREFLDEHDPAYIARLERLDKLVKADERLAAWEFQHPQARPQIPKNPHFGVTTNPKASQHSDYTMGLKASEPDHHHRPGHHHFHNEHTSEHQYSGRDPLRKSQLQGEIEVARQLFDEGFPVVMPVVLLDSRATQVAHTEETQHNIHHARHAHA